MVTDFLHSILGLGAHCSVGEDMDDGCQVCWIFFYKAAKTQVAFLSLVTF